MARRVISPDVPEPPPGTFSNALAAGNTIYMSGMHADVVDGKVVGDASFTAQARATLRKLEALVKAAGGTVADIVKLTVYVTDIARRAEVGAVRKEFFIGDFPCSTLVAITALAAPDLAIEIDAIAVIGSGKG